jgi:hypothetical protein
MYLRTTFILVCVLISAVNNAQTWQWAQNWGSNLKEFGEYIGQDAAGNLYVKGTLTKYTGQSGGFINYSMVYKFTSAGTFLWCDTLPLTTAMVADPQGNFYTAGGNQVAKYDSAGQQQWIVSYPNYYHLFNLCMHPQGGVVVQGCQSLASVFLRLDSLGNELWQRTNDFGLGGPAPLVCDNKGNAYVIYDATPAFIYKFSNAGAITGTIQIPPNSYHLSFGTDSSYCVSGFSSATGTVYTNFINNYDYAGSLLWTQYITGSYLKEWKIAHDSQNNIYLAGKFSEYIQAGNHTVNTVGGQVFVTKFNVMGNVLWLKNSLGGPGSSVETRDMVLNTSTFPAEIYLTGSFDGTHCFDSYTLNIGGGGYSDIFIGKIVQSVSVGEEELKKRDAQVILSIYPSPTNGLFNIACQDLKDCNVQVRVINNLGETLYSEEQKHKGGQYSKVFDLSSLPKGIYFVEVNNGTEKTVKKIVLE